MKLWSGRFKKKTHPEVDRYNASIPFDQKLASFDIQGSLAHARMLHDCKLIPTESAELIFNGLVSIKQQFDTQTFTFQTQDEDIHMAIEKRLHQEIGEAAGVLHTGRSRNDQVALDLHLYLRHEVNEILKRLITFNKTLLTLAEQHVDTIMPGYTHLQRAEPISLAHHLLAYFNMFYRDIQRLQDSLKRINVSPLGAGALAGSGFTIDSEHVAKQLNFEGTYENSLDAVSDRDFIVEFLSHASIIMMHLSKLSEEIILWSSQEFSFIELDDAFSTGSSMMPQKKNPDVAELARGKTGRVYGALMGMLTVLKGLPLAYNKDLQEDKEGLFDTVKTLKDTLTVYGPMLATMRVNKDHMKQAATSDYSNATQLANYLTKKGVSFRKAHEITGHIVLQCIKQNCWLNELDLEQYKKFSTYIEKDIYEALKIESVINAHCAKGGTAKEQVLSQLKCADKKLATIKGGCCTLK